VTSGHPAAPGPTRVPGQPRSSAGEGRLRNASLTRPSSRGVLMVTAVALVVAAAGLTAGSAAAVGQQTVSLPLGYSCSFPSGSRPVSVQVTATFPATATSGQPVKPTGTGITVTLPRAVAAHLARPHTTSITMTAELGTEVTDGSASGTALWRNFRSPATAVPSSGPVELTASGAAPAVTVSAPGQATVAAADLALLLRPLPTAASGQAASTPMAPASVQVACVPRAGQDTTLAKFAVTGPARPRTQGHQANPQGYPGENTNTCQPFPKNLTLNPNLPLPAPYRKATPLPPNTEYNCSFAVGFTNAARLHEAVLVGPGLTNLVVPVKEYIYFKGSIGYVYEQVAGQFSYDRQSVLPPARGTLLAFGFMPVSASLQLSEIGSMNIALLSCSAPPKKKCPGPNETLLHGLVTLRVYDVDVNGVPLNVGPHCQTTPFPLDLIGTPPTYSFSTISGILTGYVTVPYFTGCHNGPDNLDPIFNATVSGSGNYVKVNQATFCAPSITGPGSGCPAHIPHPVH
jgi:hypothetical protein